MGSVGYAPVAGISLEEFTMPGLSAIGVCIIGCLVQ